jgi:hypothetical protein
MAVLGPTIRWIAEKFAAAEVGNLAQLAWKALKTYFGW